MYIKIGKDVRMLYARECMFRYCACKRVYIQIGKDGHTVYASECIFRLLWMVIMRQQGRIDWNWKGWAYSLSKRLYSVYKLLCMGVMCMQQRIYSDTKGWIYRCLASQTICLHWNFCFPSLFIFIIDFDVWRLYIIYWSPSSLHGIHCFWYCLKSGTHKSHEIHCFVPCFHRWLAGPQSSLRVIQIVVKEDPLKWGILL